MAQREAVFPAKRQALFDKHGYSAAVIGRPVVRVGSGWQPPRRFAEPDFEAQVRRAFANLEATLAAGRRLKELKGLTPYEAICKV